MNPGAFETRNFSPERTDVGGAVSVDNSDNFAISRRASAGKGATFT